MTERTEARQVAALASVTVRTAEMAEARSRWLAAILTAHAAGRSVRAIAEVAGVSRQLVWRLVND